MFNKFVQKCLMHSWILAILITVLAPIFSYAAMDVQKTGGNVKANGIQIEYETFGDPSSPPLLLISGLGAQMIASDEEVCKQLADKGLYVIRFDNRDVGLSTKLEELGAPNLREAITAYFQGQRAQSPYSLEDMADDAIGLLNALGIKKAHILGTSMGAAITQVIGYRHPTKILSLIIMHGTTGNPGLPQPRPEVMKFYITPAPKDREAIIENKLTMQKVLWGSFPFDEDYWRKRMTADYDRSYYPAGVRRHMAAYYANGNRKPQLASITAPTLVIQGAEDPLFPVECGKDIAEAIPGAKLLIIDKMGHSMPKEARPQVVEAIVKHTSK